MKKLLLLAGVCFLSFTSCKKDDDTTTDETTNGALNGEYTWSASTTIEGNAADYKVFAMLVNADKKTINSRVADANSNGDYETIEQKFIKNIVLEDYTGAWCGYCPYWAYILEDYSSQVSTLITVALHEGDSMEVEGINTLMNTYDIGGFPTVIADRTTDISDPSVNSAQVLNSMLDEAQNNCTAGLAITSNLNGNTLDIEVKSKFNENYNDVKLVVMILKDGIVANQANYYNEEEQLSDTPLYGAGNPIIGYVHNHVVVEHLTNVLGNEIN